MTDETPPKLGTPPQNWSSGARHRDVSDETKALVWIEAFKRVSTPPTLAREHWDSYVGFATIFADKALDGFLAKVRS